MASHSQFHTRRLILRRWEQEDAQALYEYASDPSIGLSAGFPPHQTVEESRRIIQTLFSDAPEAYAVCLQSDNRAIGSIELKQTQRAHNPVDEHECALGFWIGKPFWGQGLIAEAASELLRHAFEDLQMHTVWCRYYDGNLQSKRVQEKLGFEYQWTLEKEEIPALKTQRTVHVSSLTREQWTMHNKKNQE